MSNHTKSAANRIAAAFATADMVGNSRSPMANTGALFRDLRSAILAATNIGVSPRAGLLTKPAEHGAPPPPKSEDRLRVDWGRLPP